MERRAERPSKFAAKGVEKMAYYLVHYAMGERGEFLYPSSIAGIAWKSVVYHHKEPSMIGETDAAMTVDNKTIISLKPAMAKRLMEDYKSSFPEPKRDLKPLPLRRGSPSGYSSVMPPL
jgi:hypothetical protein